MTLKVAMLLDHPGHLDTRVAREANILNNAGYIVKIFCLNSDISAKNFQLNNIEYVQCFDDKTATIPYISRLSHFTRNLWNSKKTTEPSHVNTEYSSNKLGLLSHFKRVLGTAFSFRQNYKVVSLAVRNFAPDIIHAHDLSMLYAGRCISQSIGAKSIYDSHEYECDRNTYITPLEHKIRMYVERKNIQTVDAIITVSDSIADCLVKQYDVNRPLVYLNVGAGVKKDNHKAPNSRHDYGLPESVKIGIYVGMLTVGRGIEEMLDAVALTPGLHVAILGNASMFRISSLRQKTQNLHISARVHFLAPVPEQDVITIMGLCDFAWIPIQNTCQSYNFSLPNKLFQSQAAGLPIFATPLLEISKFVQHFNLGHIAKGFDGPAQAEDLKTFLPNLGQYFLHVRNSDSLSAYSYDVMRETLLKLYTTMYKIDEIMTSRHLPHMQADHLNSCS